MIPAAKTGASNSIDVPGHVRFKFLENEYLIKVFNFFSNVDVYWFDDINACLLFSASLRKNEGYHSIQDEQSFRCHGRQKIGNECA